MLASSSGPLGVPAASSREWVTAHSVHRRPWTCCHRRAQVQASAWSSSRGYGDFHDPWKEEERRQALLKYVQEVQPQSVTQFAEQTHPVVVQAMRQTVLNVVGSLPPQYFNVRITSMAESLAQLMLSIMTTGYMLRSAQFRLELQKSLKQLPSRSSASLAPATVSPSPAAVPVAPAGDVALGSAPLSNCAAATAPGCVGFLSDGDGSPYAPGVQKKNVEGEVLRWHLARGEVERLAAADYIELLETELAALRAQVAQQSPPVLPAELRPSSPPASTSTSPSFSPTQLATAGAVEVLGPDTDSDSGQSLACVSPLPGFGERAGAGLPFGSCGGGALAAGGGSNAAAPATMGCGGIPLVVGSPLGLPRNELLDYLHGLQASGSGGFKELACSPSTASGQAVKEAMELFVTRLMGTLDPAALSKEAAEFNSVELSKVLFWLMAVGYTLKSIEARLDMDDGTSGGGASSGAGGSPSGGLGGSGGGARSSSDAVGSKPARTGLFSGLRGLLPGF